MLIQATNWCRSGQWLVAGTYQQSASCWCEAVAGFLGKKTTNGKFTIARYMPFVAVSYGIQLAAVLSLVDLLLDWL